MLGKNLASLFCQLTVGLMGLWGLCNYVKPLNVGAVAFWLWSFRLPYFQVTVFLLFINCLYCLDWISRIQVKDCKLIILRQFLWFVMIFTWYSVIKVFLHLFCYGTNQPHTHSVVSTVIFSNKYLISKLKIKCIYIYIYRHIILF
jgi:uncharacterized membrane protein